MWQHHEQQRAHGMIYAAFLNYIQVAERQDPDRTWLEREMGAPKDWLAREPEARSADEIAVEQQRRHQQAEDSLYAVTNPNAVFFCDTCWATERIRVPALWADEQTRQLCCPVHTSLAEWEDMITTGVGTCDENRPVRYARLFGNDDADSATCDEEVARRFDVLKQLGDARKESGLDWWTSDAEHHWALMDGEYDALRVRPFFNPEHEGALYPFPPERIQRLKAQ